MRNIFCLLFLFSFLQSFGQPENEIKCSFRQNKDIMGKWQSTEDSKAFIIVKNGNLQFKYMGDDDPIKTNTYFLKCYNIKDSNKIHTDIILFIVDKEDTTRYFVDNLSKKHLTLIHESSGNLLLYQKVE